ncbi:MAG: hypothetical protein LBS50_10225 [Prevotellaceae bacterium]|jgi:sporulation protein YlmC with PRC-barrel domain|nr:hypothetical protein [Prevotellaceae bacterium]
MKIKLFLQRYIVDWSKNRHLLKSIEQAICENFTDENSEEPQIFNLEIEIDNGIVGNKILTKKGQKIVEKKMKFAFWFDVYTEIMCGKVLKIQDKIIVENFVKKYKITGIEPESILRTFYRIKRKFNY